MIASRNLPGHVQPEVCTCPNGGKPMEDGFIHISVCCPVHRIFHLSEQGNRSAECGWQTPARGRSRNQ